ncbi:hypothetical protein EDC04DRAFT_2882285 [Pisolithus marmoratus]|nr:hypothetical protein EDC04DRAFT_2882285 [Pisolithus marmoratus]
MGEGKSSIIVPATASVLADGNKLVRAVVPKALASQMFHILVDRLGGLAGRRIFYLPFSRSLHIDRSGAREIQAILEQCVRERGILVVQPEHILSFKLLSVEKQLGDTTDIAEELLQTQRWLHSHARDILDESDEVLHVRNQLIYAIGLQRPLEGSPTRWSTTQQILRLVKKHAPVLHAAFPLGVEYEHCHRHSGAFPHIRILHLEAGKELISRIAQDIMDGRLFNFSGTRGIERTAIHHFIVRIDVTPSEVQTIREYCGGTIMWMTLLHLRGLLACGVLLFVPHGTTIGALATDSHPGRTMLALPANLRQISGVNTQSLDQWNQHLFPIFSPNQVVFPKEVKEFPSKLSSCGWDIAEGKEHVTTGFSGTNDARYLLPISTIQQDPDHQRATNAKVLAYLLMPENDSYLQTSWADGRRRTADEFLQLVVKQTPEIRVILDVGAQVLELQNDKFAALWLELKPDALAAIYFDDDDELTVLSREGTTQSLLESPYASRLDECVVYLDDVHTRGTDVKFPIGSRAAVTLGPKVTKDRLIQGCMRMRKLGHGHSVMFFAPVDVDRKIRDAARKSDGDIIRPSDVLLWAMGETWMEIQNSTPYWAQQGRDHTSRGEITSQELASTWCQPDAKTLEQLYVPSIPGGQPTLSIPAIDERCRELGVSCSPNSNMNEEQEREIVHEREHDTQVSADIRHFVRTGMIKLCSTTFALVFDSLRDAATPTQEQNVWSRHIFATSDYCTVVKGQRQPNAGEYLRPVNWILSSQSSGNITLVILSPFEVNELLPEIRSSKSARMRPCDDLPDWSAPTSLVDQVNLFAGQLYLRDYNTYLRLSRFLCIYADDLAGEGNLEVESDGFITPAHRPPRAQTIGSFQNSPLPFLKYVFGLRRRGMNFAATHMGKILNGRSLEQEDFEEQYAAERLTDVPKLLIIQL